MKKILSLALCLLMATAIHSQQGPGKKNRMQRFNNDFTPAQQAELKTKKLTLALDLSDKQQSEMLKFQTAQATKRAERMKTFKEGNAKNTELSSDERFALMNQRLDEAIASKKKLQSILNADQYEKYTQLNQFKKRKAMQNMQPPKRPR